MKRRRRRRRRTTTRASSSAPVNDKEETMTKFNVNSNISVYTYYIL
jgi:hypothetical protein